jgi:hypothetical protein
MLIITKHLMHMHYAIKIKKHSEYGPYFSCVSSRLDGIVSHDSSTIWADLFVVDKTALDEKLSDRAKT